MVSGTHLTEDVGLQFWALWKEMAEQLKEAENKKRQLATTQTGLHVFVGFHFLTH